MSERGRLTVNKDSWHYRYLFTQTFKSDEVPTSSNLCQYMRRCMLACLFYATIGVLICAVVAAFGTLFILLYLAGCIILPIFCFVAPNPVEAFRQKSIDKGWFSFSSYSIKGTRIAPWLLLGPASIWWIVYLISISPDWKMNFLDMLIGVGIAVGFAAVVVGAVAGGIWCAEKAAKKLGNIKPKREKKEKPVIKKQPSLAVEWVKAKKSKICPLVEFA